MTPPELRPLPIELPLFIPGEITQEHFGKLLSVGSSAPRYSVKFLGSTKHICQQLVA